MIVNKSTKKGTRKRKGHIYTLPSDVLLKIFSDLDVPNLSKMCFVSRLFRSVAFQNSLKLKERMMTKVYYYIDIQDFDKALEELYYMRKLFPYWSELWKEIGLCWRDKMYMRRSLKCIRIAKRLSKDPAEQAYLDANIQLVLKNDEEACRYLGEAIKLNPSNHRYYHFRAFIVSYKHFENESALNSSVIEDYKKIMEMHKVTPYNRIANIYNNMGYSYYLLKDYDTAMLYYSKCIKECPNHTLAYANRSIAHQDLGNLKESFQDNNMIIKLNPKLLEFHAYNGWVYARSGNIEKAIHYYSLSKHKVYYEEQIVVCYISLLLSSGDITKAFDELEFITKQTKIDIQKVKTHLKKIEDRDTMKDTEPIDFDDMIYDDFYSEATFSETKEARKAAINLQTELLLIMGRIKEATKGYEYLCKRNYKFDKGSFLKEVMNPEIGPKFKNISKSCYRLSIDFISHKVNPVCGTFMRHLEKMGKPFKNIDESIFFVSAFAYRYLALFIPREEEVSLEKFLGLLREEFKRSKKYLLKPIILVYLLRIYARTEAHRDPVNIFTQLYSRKGGNLEDNLIQMVEDLIQEQDDGDSFAEEDQEEIEEEDDYSLQSLSDEESW